MVEGICETRYNSGMKQRCGGCSRWRLRTLQNYKTYCKNFKELKQIDSVNKMQMPQMQTVISEHSPYRDAHSLLTWLVLHTSVRNMDCF